MNWPNEKIKPHQGMCVCGHDPHEDPNRDCERCMLIQEINRLMEHLATEKPATKTMIDWTKGLLRYGITNEDTWKTLEAFLAEWPDF